MEKETNPILVAMGERIASRRKQLGLTQEQAAELTGVSHQFFACVERGIKNIRSENVIKLSIAFDISTDYILKGESNQADYNHIASLLKPLDEPQLKCLEEIIKQYLVACNLNEQRF
ncbi:MAG: helix-turn-helix transcriptional regulator [Eubacteriales bacterium]